MIDGCIYNAKLPSGKNISVRYHERNRGYVTAMPNTDPNVLQEFKGINVDNIIILSNSEIKDIREKLCCGCYADERCRCACGCGKKCFNKKPKYTANLRMQHVTIE